MSGDYLRGLARSCEPFYAAVTRIAVVLSAGNRMTSGEKPLSDITKEAIRLLDAAAVRGVPVRLIGGLAVRLHAEGDILPSLRREPKDIDLVTLRGKGNAIGALIEALGYSPNLEFNHLNGHKRLLYYDLTHSRQVDVFVGAFEMCHVIPISDRIDLDARSIPLAELLLTKLQVVRLNEKDQRDIIVILSHHAVGESDNNIVNAAYVAHLCARDWGLWRTTKMNLERTREALPRYALPEDTLKAVIERLASLLHQMEAEPKTTRWRLRSRIGDRLPWYEEPDEV